MVLALPARQLPNVPERLFCGSTGNPVEAAGATLCVVRATWAFFFGFAGCACAALATCRFLALGCGGSETRGRNAKRSARDLYKSSYGANS